MSNAWTLLGLEPTSDLRTIKKAYAQRIKRIDAEKDPAGFQALRDAFDFAKQQAQYIAEQEAEEESANTEDLGLDNPLQEPTNESLASNEANANEEATSETTAPEINVTEAKASQDTQQTEEEAKWQAYFKQRHELIIQTLEQSYELINQQELDKAEELLSQLLHSDYCYTLDDRYEVSARLIHLLDEREAYSTETLKWVQQLFQWNDYENPFNNHQPYSEYYNRYRYYSETAAQQQAEKEAEEKAEQERIAKEAEDKKNRKRNNIVALLLVLACIAIPLAKIVHSGFFDSSSPNYYKNLELDATTDQASKGKKNKSENYPDIKTLLSMGEQSDAMKGMKKAAINGNTALQLKLGKLYLQKSNGLYDTPAAFWLNLAAENNTEAANLLTEQKLRLLSSFEKTEIKRVLRTELKHKIYELGYDYYHGEDGFPQDYKKAFYWFYSAAEQGVPEAQGYIGLMYAKGQWATKNAKKSQYWYNKAFKNGYKKPASTTSLKSEGTQKQADIPNSLYIPKMPDFGATQTKQAEEPEKIALPSPETAKGREGLVRRSLAGNTDAQLALGKYYLEQAEESDRIIARFWLQLATKRSSEATDLIAKHKLETANSEEMKDIKYALRNQTDGNFYNLGFLYYHGQEGFPKDYQQALYWFIKASGGDHADSQNYVGIMYKNGYGTDKNSGLAVKWLEIASKNGSKHATWNLGSTYYDLERYASAVPLLESVKDTQAQALQLLVSIYGEGKGVYLDLEKARAIYEQSLSHPTIEKDTKDKTAFNYCVALTKADKYNEAFPILMSLVESGDLSARNMLYGALKRGWGEPSDVEKFINDVKHNPQPDDANFMGWLYLDGNLAPQDTDQVRHWAAKLEQTDSKTANYLYGFSYYIDKDYKAAREHFLLSAEEGHGHSHSMLGFFYENALGVKEDKTAALSLYKKAIELGETGAQEDYDRLTQQKTAK